MGFHYEEEHIVDGSIDNRVRGKTVVTINFANHTSSLVTLQGNPCRDLAGSLWRFRNPHGKLDESPGEPCYFIPALCEGAVGRISYSRKREVAILPPEEHYDMLFDETLDDPPTKVAPVLELEWFSQKYGQVEIDCEQMTLELVEMVWSMTAKEAKEEAELVKQLRGGIEDDWEDEMELIEDYLNDDDVEPHELEEITFLIVQNFVINGADRLEQNKELHGDLLKLQEQVAGAFVYYTNEGTFEDVSATSRLLGRVLPFVDRALKSARFVEGATAELLEQLRSGLVRLQDELARSEEG